MKKRVGVITFHSAHNQGALLQTYALQKVLSNNNYDAEVINYRNKKIDKNFKVFTYNFSNIKTFIRSIGKNILFININFKKNRVFENFIQSKFKLSKIYKNEKELKNNPPDYDVYITGSDQVWSYYLLGDLEDSYTLNFGENNKRRISYAASAGDSDKVLANKDVFKKKLNVLDKISVRENETKRVLENFINKNIEVVLDPTLLLTKNQWNKVCDSLNQEEKEKYILVYSIGMHKENARVANFLSNETGLKIIHFERVNRFDNVLKNAFLYTPFEFINLIKNAEYIVTTSFHATIFSIIFNKKFWSISPPKAGLRISNLLEKLELSDRMVETLEDFKKKIYSKEINYKKTNMLLEKEREKSIKWLIDSIEEG